MNIYLLFSIVLLSQLTIEINAAGATHKLHLLNSPNILITNKIVRLNLAGSNKYHVQIYVGESIQESQVQYLVVDPGSSVIWMQDISCVDCFIQTSTKFDPSTSDKVYRKDPMCKGQFSGGENEDICVYGVNYGFGFAQSYGHVYKDFLHMPDHEVHPINKKIYFGSAILTEPTGIFAETTIGGIFGLGNDQISYIGQTAQEFNNKFSLCYGSMEGELRLGDDVPNVDNDQFKRLKFLSVENPSHYVVGLNGISVNGQPLDLTESELSGSGVLIDTGTSPSRIKDHFYTKITDKVTEHFENHKYVKVTNPKDGYESCYGPKEDADNNEEYPTFLRLEFHLSSPDDQGASMSFTGDELFTVFGLEDLICLEMKRIPQDITILGLPQLKHTLLVFDRGSQELTYRQEVNCFEF